MKKISIIFGTRPEAIKLAPIVLALRANPSFTCQVCVTAQHREMLDQVLDVFGVVPDVDLNLMQNNQTLAEFTSRAITNLNGYLERENPNLVLIQGDTTTVFCAALAAFYQRVPVGHVEAGLRTRDLYSPWPEEANRCLTTRLAALHFAPTENNRNNLLREGVDPATIFVTGNTIVDALNLAVKKIRQDPPEIPSLPVNIGPNRLDHPLVLITGHRRENFGKGFELICQAISILAERFPETIFVYPVHLNPNVREPVYRIVGNKKNVLLIKPLGYLQFLSLMDRSKLILTDSGGVQEEAPSFGKPVLILRDTTERPEGIEAGSAQLTGTDISKIVEAASLLLTDPNAYANMSQPKNPYGDGKATERILKICANYLKIPFLGLGEARNT